MCSHLQWHATILWKQLIESTSYETAIQKSKWSMKDNYNAEYQLKAYVISA